MWRRIAEMLGLRHPSADATDERSTKARQLSGMEREVRETNVRLRAIAKEAHGIERQSRLGSYARVRVHR